MLARVTLCQEINTPSAMPKIATASIARILLDFAVIHRLCQFDNYSVRFVQILQITIVYEAETSSKVF